MKREEIRAFIAIELGEAARRAAAELALALARRPSGDAVRWVRAESLHVTLRFLGPIESTRVPEIARGVGERLSDRAPFELGLGAVGAFPSPRRPRVIALAVEPPEPLAELAAAVERGVVALGFEPESRRFRAHLTLGRLRGGRPPDLDGVAPLPPSPFLVAEALLFRSELGPRGAHYTPLERMGLGG